MPLPSPAAGGILSPDAAKGEGQTDGEPIIDPHGAMRAFYASLERTEARAQGALTRVLHYGDSVIDLERITGPLRRRLQQRFGDAGHGFVLAGKPWRWYNHQGVGLVASDSGWEHVRLVGGRRGDGRLGLGCAAVERESGKPWVKLLLSEETAAAAFEIHYLARPGGGSIEVELDGVVQPEVSTAAPTVQAGFAGVRSDKAVSTLTLRARGKVRLFGVDIRRPGPGLVWDNLPMVSTRFHQMAAIEAGHFEQVLAHVAPTLVVFQFGANDTLNFGGDLTVYGEQIAKVLTRVHRAAPAASCLVIGPMDRLERSPDKGLFSPPVVRRVSGRQREVALENRCAFWDAQTAMGGPGSMERWLRRGHAVKDMVHLTPSGSEAMSVLLEAALLRSAKSQGSGATRR